MGGRLFYAGMVIVLVLAFLPAVNDVLTILIEDLLITQLGIEGFELAWWKLVPIILFGYLLIVLPIQILAGKGFGKRPPPSGGDSVGFS